jgi:hypothetical protein
VVGPGLAGAERLRDRAVGGLGNLRESHRSAFPLVSP